MKNILMYDRNSKFGYSRMIATMMIFLICCIKITLNSPHIAAKLSFGLAGVGVIFIIYRTASEMMEKYNSMVNITPQENILRLLITLLFGAVLIMNFTPMYQAMVGAIILLLLVARIKFK